MHKPILSEMMISIAILYYDRCIFEITEDALWQRKRRENEEEHSDQKPSENGISDHCEYRDDIDRRIGTH